jgi:hypothetical protein
MPGAGDLRLGHALRGGPEAVREAVEIARGDRTLVARAPADPGAVDAAEQALGISADARPIYAYIGDLNPALGTVGLVVARSWLTTLHGVTRCDSGGLGGRRGAFATLEPGECMDALHDLTFAGEALTQWAAEFQVEIDRSYRRNHLGYVEDEVPNTTSWSNDVRARCIGRAMPSPDRRLWTWEARLDTGPPPGDVVAIALSEGAAMVLDDLYRQGVDVPDHVRVVRGSSTAAGAQFHSSAVRELLAGEA